MLRGKTSKRKQAAVRVSQCEAEAADAEAEGGGMMGAGGSGGALPEVGRLVDASQADDRRMIQLVRQRRLLYARVPRNNMPVASYYSQVKRLWQEVADNMGWSVADVRRKWSHIRNSYSRHLRNEMYGVRTGRGRMVSRWYLADELEFLREHMATDARSSSRYSYTPLYLEMTQQAGTGAGGDGGGVEQLDGKPSAVQAQAWCALAGASPTPSVAAAAPLQLTVEPLMRPDDSCSPHSFEPDENSAYFHFFRGIYNDYQELPAPKQRLFRRECLTFLHRLLDEEEAQEQKGAINLSHSPDMDNENETSFFHIDKVEPRDDGDFECDDSSDTNQIPH